MLFNTTAPFISPVRLYDSSGNPITSANPLPVTPGSSSTFFVDPVPYGGRVDAVGGGVFYIGDAAPGSATSSAVWRISKITLTAGPDVVIAWAAGAATFSQIWDNRLALSYV